MGYYNASGCADPTPYTAMKEMDRQALRVAKTVKTMVELAGFDILGKIEVKDKKTGKKYSFKVSK